MAGQRTTGWVGWIWFAAMMTVLLGVFNVIDGLVALFNDKLFLVGNNLVAFDFTVWGWIHLAIGVLQLIGGFALFSGRGRVLVSLLLIVNAVVQMAFLPVYPMWSILVIALDIITLYAIIVHGHEARALAAGDAETMSDDYRAGYRAGSASGPGRPPAQSMPPDAPVAGPHAEQGTSQEPRPTAG